MRGLTQLLGLLLALIIVLAILGAAVTAPEGDGNATRTEFSAGRTNDGGFELYIGPPGQKPADPSAPPPGKPAIPAGIPMHPTDYQPCPKAYHGWLSGDGQWICIEDGHNPGNFRWRPWPER